MTHPGVLPAFRCSLLHGETSVLHTRLHVPQGQGGVSRTDTQQELSTCGQDTQPQVAISFCSLGQVDQEA